MSNGVSHLDACGDDFVPSFRIRGKNAKITCHVQIGGRNQGGIASEKVDGGQDQVRDAMRAPRFFQAIAHVAILEQRERV